MIVKKLRHNPGRLRAIVYAVLVHAVVIGVAVIGFRWSVQSPPGEVIQAVAVPETSARKPEETDKRVREEEEARHKAEEAERRREAELKKKQDEELAHQRLIAERKKKEAEEKQQKRAQEEQRKQEQTQRQKAAEQTLKEQLVAEEKSRQAAATAARAATEVDRYKALIRSQVTRNWNRPGTTKGLKCEVLVRLTPGGEVVSAQVTRTSGNAVFDRSVENAVYKAAPLPLPADPALFDNFREIRFVFDPDKEPKT